MFLDIPFQKGANPQTPDPRSQIPDPRSQIQTPVPLLIMTLMTLFYFFELAFGGPGDTPGHGG